MKTLKLVSVISFLVINGLGPHGIPNFAGIPLYLYTFLVEVFAPYSKDQEVSWLLGLTGFFSYSSILIIVLSKKYKGRYFLIFAFISLLATEVFFSSIFNYHEITFWFAGPLVVFILSSVWLITKNFKKPNEVVP